MGCVACHYKESLAGPHPLFILCSTWIFCGHFYICIISMLCLIVIAVILMLMGRSSPICDISQQNARIRGQIHEFCESHDGCK